MNVHEIKTKTISLDESDIRTAIVFWLKERAIREVKTEEIEFNGHCTIEGKFVTASLSVTIKITEELNPENAAK